MKPIAIAAISLTALLAGCGKPPVKPDDNVAAEVVPPTAPERETVPRNEVEGGGRAPADGTAQPLPTDAWAGHWTGPEGLFLDIATAGERGRYAITIKGDLDSSGDKVAGIADGDTIRFVRGGTAETLRAGTGAATGLKWLAEKKDCLVVKPGEGFCRD